MNCPTCKKKMELKGKDFSYNHKAKPAKKYSRKLFWCKKDDIWVNVEKPA